MTETQMNMGAIAVELGLPLALIVLMAFKPKTVSRAIVVLGAVFPALCLYGAVTISYVFSRGKSDIFSFFAMWLMTFAPYVAVAFGGLAVSFIGKPTGKLARFGMGLLSAPIAYFSFVLLVALILR